MKRRAIAAVLALLLLAGCAAPAPDAEAPESSRTETRTEEPRTQEDSALDAVLLSDESYWRQYWLPLAIYGQQPNYRRDDGEVHPYNGPYLFVAAWMAQEGWLANYPRAQGENLSAVIPFEEFLIYVGAFFGDTYADPAVYTGDPTLSGRIDLAAGTIALSEIAGYDPDTGSWDPREGLFLDRRTFEEIELFEQDGISWVRLRVTRYDDATLQEIDRHEEYLYYWDDMVGFVVSESSWTWPDTDRVRVEGAAAQVDALWGATPETMLWESGNYYMDALSGDPGLFASGGRLHRLRLEGDALLADSLDMGTLNEEAGWVVHRFAGETTLWLNWDRDGVFVYTDRAAYRFDGDLSLLRSAAWPQSVWELDVKGLVVNESLTRVAWAAGDDLYHCAMEEDAEPALLAAAPEAEHEFDIPSLFPIRYLENDGLFVGVPMWERIGAFQVLDADGELVRELPYAASGMHSGGTCGYSRSGAFFAPLEGGSEYRALYYDFAEDALADCDWLDAEVIYKAMTACADPSAPAVWYFSHQEDVGGREQTTVYRVDFAAGTATWLDLSVTGTEAYLLGCDEAGRLLLAYAYKNEGAYLVCDPSAA